MHPAGEKQQTSSPRGPKPLSKYRQQPQLTQASKSLPLSSLTANDSGPLQVNYGTEQPLAVSTPRAITTPAGEIQFTDTY